MHQRLSHADGCEARTILDRNGQRFSFAQTILEGRIVGGGSENRSQTQANVDPDLDMSAILRQML